MTVIIVIQFIFVTQYRYRYRQGFGQKSIGDIASDTFFKKYRRYR